MLLGKFSGQNSDLKKILFDCKSLAPNCRIYCPVSKYNAEISFTFTIEQDFFHVNILSRNFSQQYRYKFTKKNYQLESREHI